MWGIFNGLFQRTSSLPFMVVHKFLMMNPKLSLPLGTPLQINQQPNRTLISYSRLSGKRKTVKTISKRFFRLNWGAWIRPISGRHKGLWKKTRAERKRARYHVFLNATQCTMLDKMVTKFWRRPRYYVDDIYEPYQKRENFWITRSR